jgi:replication factor C subunit 3/5
MVLWVEKYRPNQLSKLELHSEINERLIQLIDNPDFPHLLLYGPSGGGKCTRIHALLRSIYGRSVDKQRVQNKQIKIKSKVIDISCISSNYHIEINPSDVGLSDRFIISEVIKEIAQTQNVSTVAQSNNNNEDNSISTITLSEKKLRDDNSMAIDSSPATSSRNFKIVVLNEADKLSMQAQQALRRTMEKYTSTCRLILVCESLSRVIAPLRSRCLPVRVPAPTEPQISKILLNIAAKESLKVPESLALRIASESERNLRRAILMLEALKVKAAVPTNNNSNSSNVTSISSELDNDTKIAKPDWQQFIDGIAKLICAEQSALQLNLIRGKLYELLVNCIPPDVILKALVSALLKRVDDQIKHEIVQTAAQYDHRMAQGSKPIFHLEAFIAKFMAIYKRWILETFG